MNLIFEKLKRKKKKKKKTTKNSSWGLLREFKNKNKKIIGIYYNDI